MRPDIDSSRAFRRCGEREVAAAAVVAHAGGLAIAVGSNLALGGLLTIALWPLVDVQHAVSWLVLLVLTQAARLVIWRRYRRDGTADDPQAWLRRFRAGVIVTAGLWGAGAWLLFPVDAFAQQVFIAFVLVGVSAGAATYLAPDRAASLGFIGLANLPLVLRFVIQGDALSLSMGAIILLVGTFLAVSGARLRRLMHENIAIVGRQVAAREVLNDAASRLLESSGEMLDVAIEYGLGRAGEHLGVDRVYLFQLTEMPQRMNNSHEWCALGVASQKHELQDLPIEMAPWWWAQILRDEPVVIPDVSAMPPEAAVEREIFESLGIRALCGVPIRRGGRTLGFIGMDAVVEPREWAADEMAFLALLAGLVGGALLRGVGEAVLSERTEQLVEAQRLASLGNWKADLVSGELSWSDEIYRIFGRDPASFKPSVGDFHAAVHPDDLERVLASERVAAQTGRHDVVHRIVRPDGSIRYVHELGKMDVDEAGQPLRLIGTVQDITARVDDEQKIAAAQARLEFATQTANLGMWEYDLVRDHLVWNDQMYRLTGLAAEAFHGSYSLWDALLHPDDRARSRIGVDDLRRKASLRQPHEGGSSDLAEKGSLDALFRIRRHDNGEIRWMRGFGAVLVDDEKVPYRMVVTMLDVSQLIRAREAAEAANRAKSEFLSSMSHELRTPLNAILGFSQVLDYDEALAEDQRDNVREILKAGNHLLILVNEVLDLARIESGNMTVSLTSVELAPVATECYSLVQALAQTRGVRMSHDIAEGIAVRADSTRLKQALLNLLSNAVKYNREHGSVMLATQPAGDERLRIIVRDTGRGVDPARQAGLFEPFNRLGAEAGPVEGVGIGLSVTRRMVELMGGSVGVTSEPGVGSTFWIELPVAAPGTPRQLQRIPGKC